MAAPQNEPKENARTAALDDRVLLISRELDCDATTLFRLWTDPGYLMLWWGPSGFTTSLCEIDLRQGGQYRFGMVSSRGEPYRMAGTYREVQEGQRLVFSFARDEDGQRSSETLVTVTFAEQAGKTRLTFRQAFFTSPESRDSHHEGWNECLDKLARQVSAITA